MSKKPRTKADSQKIRRIITAVLCFILIGASLLPIIAHIFV